MRAFAPHCERNKRPILEVLRLELRDCRDVLEIGSGTGQHAVFFAREIPHVRWQPSDLPDQLCAIREWITAEGPANVCEPIALDVAAPTWPIAQLDAVFSANTAHIFAWSNVERMFEGTARHLRPRGRFLLYGPFRFSGAHTAASNEAFDRTLRAQDPERGIRDFEDLDRVASRVGLRFAADYPMPANNHLLVWRRMCEDD